MRRQCVHRVHFENVHAEVPSNPTGAPEGYIRTRDWNWPEDSAALLSSLNRHSLVVLSGSVPPDQAIPLIVEALREGAELVWFEPGDRLDSLETETLIGRHAVRMKRGAFHPLGRAFKRLSDVVLAAAALIATAPLQIVLAILITVEEGGPALFFQTRISRNGRPFKIVKLRTMRDCVAQPPDRSQRAEGPLTRFYPDPRITRLGAFLRKHKLDELPQFFNVLKGEMSIVGPRPPTRREFARYEGWQRCRLAVRPGITGQWQVDKDRNWRFDDMLHLDLAYILDWTLVRDLKIMVRTPAAMWVGK